MRTLSAVVLVVMMTTAPLPAIAYPSDECGLIVLKCFRHCSMTIWTSFKL
jgi:hypothetical protein